MTQIRDRVGTQQEAGNEKIIIVHSNALGVSGVRNFSGYPSEEYFAKLRGHAAADLYDQMRRGESQIKMCLSAVCNPIKAATWEVKPCKEDAGVANRELHAEFMKHVLFKDMLREFSQFLNEALTMVAFGHSVFEVVHKVVLNHKKFGSYTGLKVLGWRSPRTIYRWHLDKKESMGLEKITQYAWGDLNRLVDIPSQFLMVMTLDQEGDNYEGISGLRAAYGPWLRKQEYLVMQAIGIEKYAIPTPVATIPEGKQNTEQVANMEAALQNFTAHEKAYIMMPPGDWKIDFVGAQGKGGFDPEKLQKAIDAEDRNMVKAFVANFLELGGASSSGSWALSFDQSSFFKASIEHIAHLIAENVNKRIIKPLIDMNYGVQEEYPTLNFSGITDEAGEELANALFKLCEAQVIVPDDDLEDHVRRRYKLSVKSKNGQRAVIAKGSLGEPQPGTDPNNPTDPNAPGNPADKTDPKSQDPGKKPVDGNQTVPPGKEKVPADAKMSERVLLAEKIGRQQIQEGSDLLHDTMTEGLTQIGDTLCEKVMSAYRGAGPGQKQNAANGISLDAMPAYQSAIAEVLAGIAGKALKQAKREVPKVGRKSKKFALAGTAIRLAYDTFQLEDLPKEIQDKIKAKAKMLTDSQLAELKKAVTFQFQSSEGSTDSANRIEADLGEAIDSYIDGPSVLAAAGNAAAHAVNDTRNAFFFDSDTLDEIESFTFTNGDPVSPICQDLAGTTFEKDDPDAARYFPPLHHNCKSYIVPNLAGAKDNPEIDENGLTPSDPSLEKHITLSERGSKD